MLESSTTGRLISAASKLLRGLLDRAKTQGTGVQTITYSEANERYVQMDSILTRHMGRVLDLVHETCVQNGLPDLAALVVNKATGRPGERYIFNDRWEQEMQRISAYKWAVVIEIEVTIRVKML